LGYAYDYPGFKSYDFTSDVKERKIRFELERGLLVRGKVIDAKTREPVDGASVAPMTFTPSIVSPDYDRSIATDRKGSFRLSGVSNWGIEVFHQDYYRKKVDTGEMNKIPNEPDVLEVEIALESGEPAYGIVRDPEGNPIRDVNITDYTGKKTKTDKEGRFIIKSSHRELDFRRDGYDYLSNRFANLNTELSVVLKPLFRIKGCVLRPDKKPVTKFVIAAGAGKIPQSFETTEKVVEDPNGQFDIAVKEAYDADTIWVGIRADGFAPWEGYASPKVSDNLNVILQEGVIVDGEIKDLGGKGREYRLLMFPVRPKPDSNIGDTTPVITLLLHELSLDRDGKFAFKDVRPGQYKLCVFGKGITPVVQSLTVPVEGLHLDTISLQGTGKVIGSITDAKGKPQKFRSGYISIARFDLPREAADNNAYIIHFKTDEAGNFQVEEVPVGTAHICLNYMITADMVGTQTEEITIKEGETTTVNIVDKNKSAAG
jgi:hypothetical protein